MKKLLLLPLLATLALGGLSAADAETPPAVARPKASRSSGKSRSPETSPAGSLHEDLKVNPSLPEGELALKFGFIGCNRLPIKDARAQDGGNDAFTANRLHLTQTARDLQGLGARFLFLGGDWVMGEAQDATTLSRELASWSDYWGSLGVSYPLFFTPGNHEMVFANEKGEYISPTSGDQYRAWLDAHPEYNPGITPGPARGSTYPKAAADGLVDDQSRMSYFRDVPTPALRDPRFPDARYIRIVALNTDTMTNLPLTPAPHLGTGRAPWNWLASVVKEAQANPRIGGIIVMGHRPFAPISKEEVEMDPLTARELYSTMRAAVFTDSNPQGKLRCYICAHAHMHDVGQLMGEPEKMTKTNSGEEHLGVYEIVAGCCGSPLEPSWAKEPSWGVNLPDLGIPYKDAEGQESLQPYFGFQLVVVEVDGTTEVFNFGRLINPPYSRETYFQGTTEPARPLSSVTVYP